MSEANRHDILDLPDDGYISISRPRDAPPLTEEQKAAFLELAAAVVKRMDTSPPPPSVSG